MTSRNATEREFFIEPDPERMAEWVKIELEDLAFGCTADPISGGYRYFDSVESIVADTIWNSEERRWVASIWFVHEDVSSRLNFQRATLNGLFRLACETIRTTRLPDATIPLISDFPHDGTVMARESNRAASFERAARDALPLLALAPHPLEITGYRRTHGAWLSGTCDGTNFSCGFRHNNDHDGCFSAHVQIDPPMSYGGRTPGIVKPFPNWEYESPVPHEFIAKELLPLIYASAGRANMRKICKMAPTSNRQHVYMEMEGETLFGGCGYCRKILAFD